MTLQSFVQIMEYEMQKESGISVRIGFFCAYPYVQKKPIRLSDERLDEIRKNPGIPSPGLV